MERQKPVRVAWLGHKSATLGGGMATYSQEITSGLRSRGLRVIHFHHDSDQGDDQGSVPLASVPVRKPFVYSPPRARRKLEDRLRKKDFDLVHASFWFSSMDFNLPKLCRQLGIPIVATFHVAFDSRHSLWGGLTSATYRLYAPALAQCDRVIVFGQAQRDILAGLSVPDDVLRILPNGVDVEKYSPGRSEARGRFGAERLFVYMGRIDSEKNVDTLVRAFLACQPPAGVKLLLMGSGTERKRLQRQFGDERVVFTGHISDEKVRIEILRAADAFFLPSDVEGLSLSMLEAMSCGVATVATDVGGDGDALRGAGIVVEPRSLQSDLEMAMRQLIELPWLSRRLGDLARKRVLERYSLDRNLDALITLYGELVS